MSSGKYFSKQHVQFIPNKSYESYIVPNPEISFFESTNNACINTVKSNDDLLSFPSINTDKDGFGDQPVKPGYTEPLGPDRYQ